MKELQTEPKNALVTGANRGLGLECARQLTARGWRVFMAGRDGGAITAAAAEIGGTAVPVVMDVSDPESVQSALVQIGTQVNCLHLLINNAGVYPAGDSNPVTVTAAEMRRTLLANVLGPHAVLEASVPLLAAAKGACVVNVSSGLGSFHLCAGPEAEYRDFIGTCYGTSKAALNMLTVSWAKALAKAQVRVNAVSPGWCQTEMGGADADRSPTEGAATLLDEAFLDPASGPTGQFFGPEGPMAW